jgi:hypothetical protein
LSDHSKISCDHILHEKCAQNHAFTRRCSEKLKTCAKCEAERKALEAKAKRDHALAEKRDALEKEHRRKLQEIDERIREQQQVRNDHADDQARRKVLEQRGQDLAQEISLTQQRTTEGVSITSNGSADQTDARPTSRPKANVADAQTRDDTNSTHSSQPPSTGTSKNEAISVGKSPAEVDWQYQKDIEGAINEHIDALMQMIGLDQSPALC